MSTDFPPTDAARIAALEKLYLVMNARIEQLAQDMERSFAKQAQTQVAFERHIDEQFKAIDVRFNAVDARLDRIENEMKNGFAQIVALIQGGGGPSGERSQKG